MITKTTRQKFQLRQKYLPRRASLAKSAYGQKASQTILKQLQQLDCFRKARSVLFYYSGEGEIETHDLLEYYLDKKQIYLPSSSSLSVTLITKNTKLKTNFSSIKEPAKPDSRLPEKLDLTIVPGVVFDEKGFRLGRGGGWYDRLFAKVKFATKISLSFDELVIKNLPVEEHDQKVDIIITEKRIIDLR